MGPYVPYLCPCCCACSSVALVEGCAQWLQGSDGISGSVSMCLGRAGAMGG